MIQLERLPNGLRLIPVDLEALADARDMAEALDRQTSPAQIAAPTLSDTIKEEAANLAALARSISADDKAAQCVDPDAEVNDPDGRRDDEHDFDPARDHGDQ